MPEKVVLDFEVLELQKRRLLWVFEQSSWEPVWPQTFWKGSLATLPKVGDVIALMPDVELVVKDVFPDELEPGFMTIVGDPIQLPQAKESLLFYLDMEKNGWEDDGRGVLLGH
jgi:hypothetical protein